MTTNAAGVAPLERLVRPQRDGVERARFEAWYDAQPDGKLSPWDVWQAASSRSAEPLNDADALVLARKHLDHGLSWAPHITRCTDLEIRALIRAVEAAHGIGA